MLVDLDRQDPEDFQATPREQIVIATAAEPTRDTGRFDILLTAVSDPPRPWVECADPHATARQLADAVAAQPAASVALVQVLRVGAGLPLADCLILESLAYSTLQTGAGFRSWLAANPARTPRPSAQPVRVHRDGAQLTITLDRPWARNALDARTRDALCEALEVVVADPTIAAVDLRGAGPAFCAGGDLSEFGSSADPAVAHLIRTQRSPAALLTRCADRVKVNLHGPCIGAGIELAAFAHRVTATPDTTIRLPEVGMGLIPGAGGTASIPGRIGRERTAFLAISGISLRAGEALAWGLVDEIGDPAS